MLEIKSSFKLIPHWEGLIIDEIIACAIFLFPSPPLTKNERKMGIREVLKYGGRNRLFRCCLLLLIFSCAHANARFVTDRTQLHSGSPWTYMFFLGGGYYFYYEFRFTTSQLPFRIMRYHITRRISLYHVPKYNASCFRNGQVELPSGHTVTGEEYQRKLFKKQFTIKTGGLLGELYKLAAISGGAYSNGTSPVAVSNESYNLDSNYSVLDFHIQCSLSGQPPLHHWYGVAPDTPTKTIMARPGHTPENTHIQHILPDINLILGLPTMLDDQTFTHNLNLTLYEATNNLYGYMQLQHYTPMRSRGKRCIELILWSHEVQQAGGGMIMIMINPNGMIWMFNIYHDDQKAVLPVASKFPPFDRKPDDDHWPPPGGADGTGGGFFSPPLSVNLAMTTNFYDLMLALIYLGEKKRFIY